MKKRCPFSLWDEEYQDCKINVLASSLAETLHEIKELQDELAVISRKKTRGLIKWVIKIAQSVMDKVLEEEEKKGK